LRGTAAIPLSWGQQTATVERILPAIEKFWRYDGVTTQHGDALAG